MNLTKKQAYAMGMDLSIISCLKSKKVIKHNTYLGNIIPVIKERHIITGFDVLDKCLPLDGIPPSSVITIFGPYSSGKSYFLYRVIAANHFPISLNINNTWKSELLNIYPEGQLPTLSTFSSPKSSSDVASIRRTNSTTRAISFITIHTGYSQIRSVSEVPSDIQNNSEIIVSLRLIDGDNTVVYVLKNDFGELCSFPICDFNI